MLLPFTETAPAIEQLLCTNHTTGVLLAFGMNVTVTPMPMFTEVH
jgi:hypothetical protein